MYRDDNRAPLYALAALICAVLLCLMMMINLAFGAVATAQAIDQDPPRCVSPDSLRMSAAANRIALPVIELTGQPAADFVAAFNSTEPASSYRADLVLLWPLPGERILMVALFDRGCAVVMCRLGLGCSDFAPPPRAWRAPLHQVNRLAKADRLDR